MSGDPAPYSWNSKSGIKDLRRALGGEAALRALEARREVDRWDNTQIRRALHRRQLEKRRGLRGRGGSRLRELAVELDLLREVERSDANWLLLERLESKGFRGRREHFVRLLVCAAAAHPYRPGSGAYDWNSWRRRTGARPDLRGADLSDLDLRHLDFRGALLSGVNLSAAQLRVTDLSRADLQEAKLWYTDFSYADLRGAKLNRAELKQTILTEARLDGADLRRALLSGTVLNRAVLKGATLSEAVLWGISSWDVVCDAKTRQRGMIIAPADPTEYSERTVRLPGWGITVNDLEVAHFITLMSKNPKIASVIDAATERLVLLLGRFVGREAKVLAVLERALPDLGYVPVVFNFSEPKNRDTIETVAILASLSNFVIANLSRPRSTPLEAHVVIPTIAVPFVPIVREGQDPFAMFAALQRKYSWVLPTVAYRHEEHLLRILKERVVRPAERAAATMRLLKHRKLPAA